MIINPDISLNGALSAVATLMNLGYTFHGGEQWKPPLGAMPVQEPVTKDNSNYRLDPPEAEPAQRQWQSLTDEAIWSEYQTLWPFHPAEEPGLAKDIAKFARAIEAKLREKNAASSLTIPDALTRADCEGPEYTSGWNDCRAETLKGMK
jgi:hypothetical protein